jgi:ABC-type Fe3+-hydroxamate transport system substrate-binding protein
LLVGRTDFDTDPDLDHLPSVGGGLGPSLELLVALNPDLVVHFAGESDPTTPQRLQELGIPHFAVRPDRTADVRQIISDLGSMLGLEEGASAILARLDSALHNVEQRIGGRRRPQVAYLLGGNPPWVAGAGTFLHELIEAAGGVNVFGDLDVLYGPVSPEELTARTIDIVLLPEGSEAALAGIDAPVHRVSPGIEIPGPYLARSVQELAAILHPEVFE